jgi:surface carbohydrate biosynthesis protein
MRARDPRPRIALIVDHPQRDLPGMVLTAFALCERGAVCHLVPLNLQERELLALAPDLVLLNYLRLGNEEVARALMEAGVQVGLLDTEGAAWSDCGAYSELLWRERDLLRRIRPACMWGPRMADCVTDSGLLAPSQVIVTGCPRFDLYHRDWCGVLGKPVASRRPRILINTSFSGVNPRFATVEQNRRQYAEDFGWSKERIDQHLEAERQAIAGMIAIARSLARDHELAEVRVRPHPFEDVDYYRQALRDVPRIDVANDDPIQTDIFEAAVVIQRSCSTAIESAMAGVPTLSPRWVSAPVEVPIAEAVSMPCDNYAELRDQVGAVLAGRSRTTPQVSAARDAVVRDYFHSLDGRAHCRVADTAIESLRRDSSVSLQECLHALYRVRRPGNTLKSSAGARIRLTLGLSPYWSFGSGRAAPPSWWASGAKAFRREDVARVVGRVSQVIEAREGRPSVRIVCRPSTAAGAYICRFEGSSQTLEASA